MTKQQTIDQIKNSLPGFYSAEQVIEMLTKIEEPQPEIKAPAFNLETIIEEIETRMSRRLENNIEDYVVKDSAEFSIYSSNQIELDHVSIDIDLIVRACSDVIREFVISEFGIED